MAFPKEAKIGKDAEKSSWRPPNFPPRAFLCLKGELFFPYNVVILSELSEELSVNYKTKSIKEFFVSKKPSAGQVKKGAKIVTPFYGSPWVFQCAWNKKTKRYEVVFHRALFGGVDFIQNERGEHIPILATFKSLEDATNWVDSLINRCQSPMQVQEAFLFRHDRGENK